MALTNCRECGRLYNKTTHDICELCRQEVERDFETVYQFLKENGPTHVDIIHEFTKIKKKRIMKFVAEDRFDTIKITYKCESCGTEITSGRMCEKCLTKLNKEISELTKKEPPTKKEIDNERWTSLDRYRREEKEK
jgi:ribosomal protein L32